MSEIIVKHTPTDTTALLSDMYFLAMDGIFKKLFYGGLKWCIRTSLELLWYTDEKALQHMFGFISCALSLNQKGLAHILSYADASQQSQYSRDMSILVVWLKLRGWKLISPHPDLVRTLLSVWKHHWLTHLVLSEFLLLRFGKRQD